MTIQRVYKKRVTETIGIYTFDERNGAAKGFSEVSRIWFLISVTITKRMKFVMNKKINLKK